MTLEFNKSTASLLDSFPMFGHPGISALEYAGRVEVKKRESLIAPAELSSLKRKSTNTSLPEENIASLAMGSPEINSTEASPQLHFIDEFGTQQRRRGNFMNHTPRDHELRSSKPIEVYRPSRAESDNCENYSRPLSRQGSVASGSPALPTQFCRCGTLNTGSLERQIEFNHGLTTALEFVTSDFKETPDVYKPSTASTRRSVSAPLDDTVLTSPQPPNTTEENIGTASIRSTSSSSHQPQEKKRQRRQTPFKLSAAEARVPRHEPIEPWIAIHRRKRTSETIGDVPFDMNREVSAEMGAFGVIQRYFDSQGGGPVTAPSSLEHGLSCDLPDSPPPVPRIPSFQQPFVEPIAIYPIDEMSASDHPPPVPDRSPKRLTNPSFPLPVTSVVSVDTEFKFAAQGEYSPYKHLEDQSDEEDMEHSGRRVAARAGSSNLGRMAPPILGHHALAANTDLGNNELTYFFKHTGPVIRPHSAAERKKHGVRLFKAKQKRTLVARVGSVEGSPERARKPPEIPTCTREMITAAGSKHLRIVIPSETPRGSVAISMPGTIRSKKERRSRHISISFTEEMLNPLASPEVERIISMYNHNPLTDPHPRSASAPLPRFSPKRSPKFAPQCEPVTDHPLAASRKEETRARKLRDLHRIKRKPLPLRTLSESHVQSCSPTHQQSQQKYSEPLPTQGAAPLTPAQTPEPPAESSPSSPMSSSPPTRPQHHAEQNDSGIEDQSPREKMSDLQEKVILLQRQNEKLTAVLAKIVGVDLGGEGGLDELEGLGGDEVLRAWRALRLEG